MDNFSWNGYQPPQNQADPDTLTTTEGLYSKVTTWAAPAMYVSPWMPDAVLRQENFSSDTARGRCRRTSTSTGTTPGGIQAGG